MSAENSSQPVPQAAIETEAELEAFRRQWREEVSARKQPAGATSTSRQTLQKETESRKPKPPTAGITAIALYCLFYIVEIFRALHRRMSQDTLSLRSTAQNNALATSQQVDCWRH